MGIALNFILNLGGGGVASDETGGGGDSSAESYKR